MAEPQMTEDHPLYYQKGREGEIRERWRIRRLGMLVATLSWLSSVAYLGFWYYRHSDKFQWIEPLPPNVIAAIALLVLSFVGSIVYQALYFRCPRCDHFTGFEYGPNALSGELFKRESFFCYNCRVQLR
ncbi:MAG: hypothetical protein H6617_02655 [Bdellovibrionaceae bacterium]|nr:hypothetical protein [Pseudobdellovibrionaceae bacterium]